MKGKSPCSNQKTNQRSSRTCLPGSTNLWEFERENQNLYETMSTHLIGDLDEFGVMGKGQALITASYKDVPLPVLAPDFDLLN